MRLVRLVYVSRMNEECDTVALQEILDVSRKNNQAKNITGLLCYDPAFFLQCLEGPRTLVNELYASIQQDTRHKNVTLLEYSDVDSRIFADWSMAFLRARDLDKSTVQKYTGGGKFDPFTLGAQQAREFLIELSGRGGTHLKNQAHD